jgi:hypothetical protein
MAHVARRGGRLLLVAYRAIPGEPLTDERLRALPAVVQHDMLSSLAAFLNALHAYPVGAARRAGVTEQLTSGAYHAVQHELPRMLAAVLTAREIADLDFDLAVIGMFFGRKLLARLLEHLPDRDPVVVRDKASFFTTLRRLQDVRYDLDHGDPATARRAVARLREHLHSHS